MTEEQKYFHKGMFTEEISGTFEKAVIVIDGDFFIIKANKYAAKLLNYKRKELIGKKLPSLMKDFFSLLKEILHPSDDSNEIIPFDSWFISQTKIKIPLKVSGFLIKDINNNLESIILILEARDLLLEEKRNTQIFDYITKNVNEAIIITSADLTFPGPQIVFINSSFSKLTGFELNDILGKTPLFFFGPETDLDEFKIIFKKLIKGKSFKGSKKIFNKEGKEIESEISIIPISDDEGNITNFTFIISSRKKDVHEPKSIYGEESFALDILEQMSDGIVVMDLDGKQLFVNKEFCRLTGFSKEELINNLPPYKYWSKADDEKLSSTFGEIIKGFEREYELKYQKKNGQTFMALISPRKVMDPKGNVLIVTTVKDITERKRIEETLINDEMKFRQLVDNSPNAIFTINKEGIIQTWNPSSKRILGYDDNIIGSDYRILLAESIDNHFNDVLLEDVFNKKAMQNVDIVYKSQTNDFKYMDSRLYPLFDYNNEVYACVFANTDISKRKKYENELRLAKEQLEAVINAIPGTFSWISSDLKYKGINNYLANLFGYKPEEFVTNPVGFLEKYIEFTNFVKEFFNSPAKTTTKELDLNINDKDFKFLIEANKFNSNKDAVFVGLDITYKDKIESHLRDSEQRYKDIFENNPLIYFIIDGTGKIKSVNTNGANQLGYNPKELENKSFFDICCNEEKERIFENISKAIKDSKEIITWEASVTLKKEGARLFKAFAKSTKDSVNNDLILIACEDITEQKRIEEALVKSESNLKAIFDNTDDLICSINNEYHIINMNKSFKEKFSIINSREIQSGNSLWNIIPKERHIRWIEFLSIAFTGKSAYFNENFEFKDETFHFEFSLHPIWKNSTHVSGISIFAKNRTEKIQAEIALRESEKTLKELNANKDKFFSIISHDLRSPINSMLGLTEILTNDVDNLEREELREFAININRSANHLFKLLENLLEWSRIQNGRITYHADKLKIYDMVEKVISLSEISIKRKNLIILNKVMPEYEVLADHNMLTSILQNLIANAVKFSYKGGRIIIEAEKVGEMLHVSISDNGTGMDSEELSKLFRIDSNFSKSGTERESGTGLGLILCKELIEMNKGEIFVESQKEKGSKFTISLPII